MSLVPQVQARDWEDFQGFRETMLHHVTDPRANRVLRQLGQLLYSLVLEVRWDSAPEARRISATRLELQAALVDLRSLEGFFAQVGAERDESTLSAEDQRLSGFGEDAAETLRELAGRLEQRLRKRTASRKIDSPRRFP